MLVWYSGDPHLSLQLFHAKVHLYMCMNKRVYNGGENSVALPMAYSHITISYDRLHVERPA